MALLVTVCTYKLVSRLTTLLDTVMSPFWPTNGGMFSNAHASSELVATRTDRMNVDAPEIVVAEDGAPTVGPWVILWLTCAIETHPIARSATMGNQNVNFTFILVGDDVDNERDLGIGGKLRVVVPCVQITPRCLG